MVPVEFLELMMLWLPFKGDNIISEIFVALGLAFQESYGLILYALFLMCVSKLRNEM